VDAEELGIAILAYGSGGEYEALLDSLLAQEVSPESILVVHNPAQPGEAMPTVPAGCEVLQADRNLGYAAGMNLGIDRLRERGCGLLLLLTHDARLRPGALSALLSAARDRPDFGVLAPALVLAGTDTPYSFGGFTRRNGTSGHITQIPEASLAEVRGCDWVDGGTMLIRRQVVDHVGGFDERFWGYCEEADLCLRVRRFGAAVGVVPAALADQEPGGTKRPGPWSYLLTRNGIEYARRAVGFRGVGFVTARAAWTVVYTLLRVGLRKVRLRSGGDLELWAISIGTTRGAVDYYRGRWGPPPPDLPGMGDLHNA
jgi:N-acetylglucosaminyl-diphospho-decaprenol L-rhamnosyltransferase